jgi:hypothetical protein
MLGTALFAKSSDWSYEEEFRLVMCADPAPAIYRIGDPGLEKGVILGPALRRH